ncbi:MAG: hypothetical protein AB7G21_09715 [Dehalococcoidia bacterium]
MAHTPLPTESGEPQWWLIPDYMREPLRAYLEDHRRPGDFLQSVIRNDLRDAVQRADGLNGLALSGYVVFLNAWAPAAAWGSPAALEAWVAACPRELDYMTPQPATAGPYAHLPRIEDLR